MAENLTKHQESDEENSKIGRKNTLESFVKNQARTDIRGTGVYLLGPFTITIGRIAQTAEDSIRWRIIFHTRKKVNIKVTMKWKEQNCFTKKQSLNE